MESIIPAIPGRVRVRSKALSKISSITVYMIRANEAIIPGTR